MESHNSLSLSLGYSHTDVEQPENESGNTHGLGGGGVVSAKREAQAQILDMLQT